MANGIRLVIADTRRLDLEGGMLNGYVKVLGYTLLEVGEHLGGVTVTEALLVNDNMGSKCRKARSHSGGVQIMDFPNMIHIQDMRTDLVEIEPIRREFHEDSRSLAHELESPWHDEGGNEEARDGIRPLESGGGDDDRSDNHSK